MKTHLRAAVCGAALMLSGCVTAHFTETEMFQLRPAPALTAEAAAGIDASYRFQPLDIIAADGVHLRGGLLTKPGATRTVVFYGGNIATASRTGLRRARELTALNVNIALVDYRGYGGSDTGAMTTEAFLNDGLRVFDHLAARRDLGKLVVHGHSMGSLIAGHVAANRPTAGVVLESSATTTEAFAARQIPWYGKPFVRIDISPALRAQGNLQQMTRIEEPLLLIVGEQDPDTPPAFSRALYEASTLPMDRRRLVVVPGAQHSDVFARPVAVDAYRSFLDSLR